MVEIYIYIYLSTLLCLQFNLWLAASTHFININYHSVQMLFDSASASTNVPIVTFKSGYYKPLCIEMPRSNVYTRSFMTTGSVNKSMTRTSLGSTPPTIGDTISDSAAHVSATLQHDDVTTTRSYVERESVRGK